MSRESYVKFETAKLLKEKGFYWDCEHYYKPNGEIVRTSHTEGSRHINSSVLYEHQYLAPTQQMACRWLREEHNILVTVAPCEVGAGVDDYTYVIYEIQPEDYHFEFIEQGRMQPVAYTMDYEGTLEEGIKHVLTNLI
jgi:hypothetical protein